MQSVKVSRQLQDRLHQGLLTQGDIAHRVVHQRLGHGFHLACQQRRAFKLNHFQRAVNLVNCGQTGAHTARVIG